MLWRCEPTESPRVIIIDIHIIIIITNISTVVVLDKYKDLML